MSGMRTIESELALYRSAAALDRMLPRGARRAVGLVFDLGLLLFAAVAAYYHHFEGNDAYAGAFFILLGPFILFTLIAFYETDLQYRGFDAVTEGARANGGGITYEAAGILLARPTDLTRAFVESALGALVLRRCGIRKEELVTFFAGTRTPVSRSTLPLPDTGFLSFADVGMHVFNEDKAFSGFLFTLGVLPEAYAGALAWTFRTHAARKARARWWSRANLAREKGIGAEFSHGIAYELERYLRPLDAGGILAALSEDEAYDRAEVRKIETALARSRGANALLVGQTDVGIMEALAHLSHDIRNGNSVVSVESKDLVLFDSEAFVATHPTKQEFELSFLTMFAQASRAGNLIVVIERLPQFMRSAEALQVDPADLLGRFLAAPDLHIIATSDPSSFHATLEPKAEFLAHFGVVHIEDPGKGSVLRVLEDVAAAHERQGAVLFTYPALEAIAEDAERYLVEGVMPDKAIALLVEVVAAARERRAFPVTEEFVTAYVSEKTGIPAGPVGKEERDALLNLESVLHARVIGQREAITAVASAMRRARSGIESKDRPMGSFLFLGPTGVGKTETAKALAHAFFGDDSRMLRLDMSEYSDAAALARLLGDGGAPGILASMLREHPYGVLLLDEFEKSSPEVRNLFLQVLDEGVFTDARGTRVNARNSIIIATSNAGSERIFDIASRGEPLAAHKEELIEALVQGGSYTPELINRFDGVILFEPLSVAEQKQIASLMLEGLRKRVKEKGYELSVDDTLLSYLTKRGYDPKFGARPMRRLIEDTVEEKIAEKIIAGSLKRGDTISFSPQDFS